jgi:archaellum component FlaC
LTFTFTLEIVLVASITGLTVLLLFTLYLQDKLTSKVDYLEKNSSMQYNDNRLAAGTWTMRESSPEVALPSGNNPSTVQAASGIVSESETQTNVAAAVEVAASNVAAAETEDKAKESFEKKRDQEDEARVQLLISELSASKARIDEMSNDLEQAKQKLENLRENVSESNQKFELVEKQLGRLPRRLDDLEDTLTTIVKESLKASN